MRKLFFVILIIFSYLKGYSEEECILLDLETAWQRILLNAPSIAAADTEICIKEAEAEQVTTLLNPIAVIEAENMGVSHPSDEVEPLQTTYSLSQTVELGGKRRARAELASSITSIAYWDAQIEKLEIYHAFITAFIEISYAQERVKIAEKKEQIACQMLETLQVQVRNGKVSPIQEKKVQVLLMAEQLHVREAFSHLEQAKKRLAAMWGSSCPDFQSVEFDLFHYLPPPCQCALMDGLFQNPDFMKVKQLICSASKNLKLQKANRVPDVTFTVGYRVFNDSHQHGWVAGVALPLPVFDRNQGNIRKAQCEIAQAEYQLDEFERELRERTEIILERLIAMFDEAEILRNGLLAEATEACNLTQVGYQKGKLEYLDLLEAEKMFFEIEEKYIEILQDYHLTRAELGRLAGL